MGSETENKKEKRLRVHVIACGVLALDFRKLEEELNLELSFNFLPGGLHEEPGRLRKSLQEAIDAAEGKDIDHIAAGYGLCGRGTVGIRARFKPIFIPRVQDCIALFLGSDREYRRQFQRHPGTYYISAGWFREKVEPFSQKKRAGNKSPSISEEEFKEFERKYGRENAEAIAEFYGSWVENYERAAFIDTGAGDSARCRECACAMADEFGWKYERLEGSLELLEKLLVGETEDEGEVTIVPPGYVTYYDPVESAISARPATEAGLQEDGDEEREKTFSFAGKDSSLRAEGKGLGIDAGGTYTDAVIYDFKDGKVLADSKSLTTKWDFCRGIKGALDELPAGSLEDIKLTAVSTTLATNAIVEGHGQKVGLLVMPPPGIYELSEFGHQPAAAVKGKISIDGREIEPVDEKGALEAARRMMEEADVRAFAVSGYGAAANPGHELAIKKLIEKQTGCDVTCGHELSEMLNFKTRARTAVLNARIIPRLRSFLNAVREVLADIGVSAPLMVVKGDGTLVSEATAHKFPVETILSGPAASVAGARHLTDFEDATVIDVGGTTSDIAVLKDGRVAVSEEGTHVGRWQTHVRAVDMRTVGVGGDSSIARRDGALEVGPSRAVPLSWTAANSTGLSGAIEYLEGNSDEFSASTTGAAILFRTERENMEECDEVERRILDILAERPHSLHELARRAGLHHWTLLPLDRLENSFLIARCGLTPTDLLHARGEFTRWDVETARRGAEWFSQLCRIGVEEMTDRVFEIAFRRLAGQVLLKHLEGSIEGPEQQIEDCQVCLALMDRWMGDGDGLSLNVELEAPLVGLGAPAKYFLPPVSRLLGTEFEMPDCAHVANAVGAITSRIVITESVRILPNVKGEFVVEGIPGAPLFPDMESAQEHAEDAVQELVKRKGRENGAAGGTVHIHTNDRLSSTSEGAELFLERTVTATLTSLPGGVGSGGKD